MALTDTMALRGRSVGTLSGGELQRVMLARALAGDPQVLILDEPTASMDPGSETRIFELLRELTSRVTVIMSSHDVGMISRYANRIACLNRRLTVLPPAALDAEAVYAIYTGKAPGEAAA
jgi:zinc transport system ATP-binding protein